MFWAPSGIAPCEAKSMAEVAAHYSCQTHPVFENLPPQARLALLERCDGHWKQVLYFLEWLLLLQPGRSACADDHSNVVATAGFYHTQSVNRKGEIYITSGPDDLYIAYKSIAPEPQSTLRLIFSQQTSNRILQISANYSHAAFVTETGQVFTFGKEDYGEIAKPALVTALEMIPCQQVTTGYHFTVALTRFRAMYSWGRNNGGQLGLGHNRNESKPRKIIVQSDDGTPDIVVQVSTTHKHVVAVTKAGRLFTWGFGLYGCLGHNYEHVELRRPKRVEHGGFVGLFIVCASAGRYSSAAIDSSGLVYTWGHNFTANSGTPVLIDSLKAYRAVHVVACSSPYVVMDNGCLHIFGNGKIWNRDQWNKKQSRSFTIKGHKIQSITSIWMPAN